MVQNTFHNESEYPLVLPLLRMQLPGAHPQNWIFLEAPGQMPLRLAPRKQKRETYYSPGCHGTAVQS